MLVELFQYHHEITIACQETVFCTFALFPHAVGNQWWTVQPQPLQRERPGFRYGIQRSISEEQQVPLDGLMSGRVLRLGWPIVGFVLMTPVTTVQQVLRRIGAPCGVGLKMINGQFPTAVGFRDPAKLTRKMRPLSNHPSDVCGDTHAG